MLPKSISKEPELLTNVLSNFDNSRYISTNPSNENMLDIGTSFDSRYISPINKTLADSTINDSKKTLHSMLKFYINLTRFWSKSWLL